MQREVLPRPEVVKALDRWVAVQIDVDVQADVARQYEVEALPTFVVMADDGRETVRAEGSRTPEQFIEFLKRADPRTAGSRASP
jgi:thioredoxin-like negative regulator of GroEL